jgi:hypothetical protein
MDDLTITFALQGSDKLVTLNPLTKLVFIPGD